MKELVVISGKGGTGKTSLVACFAALAKSAVLADCDVDAADLHLIMDPQTIKTTLFSGGKKARVRSGHCTACGKCEEICRFDAIFFDGPGNGQVDRTFRVNTLDCEGCGVCAWFCNYNAIDFKDVNDGKWFVSDTRHGPMVHAKMNPGAENSGKLVSAVREQAGSIAKKHSRNLIIIDGSPGIGCSVIASITGADCVLIVTEPTLSAMHDMNRVAELTRHFNIKTLGVINKYDLNHDITNQIEHEMAEKNIACVGKIKYDNVATQALIAETSIVEFKQDGISKEIEKIWHKIEEYLY